MLAVGDREQPAREARATTRARRSRLGGPRFRLACVGSGDRSDPRPASGRVHRDCGPVLPYTALLHLAEQRRIGVDKL